MGIYDKEARVRGLAGQNKNMDRWMDILPFLQDFIPFWDCCPKIHIYELCSRITSKQIRTDACGWSHIAANSIFFSKNTYIQIF